MTNGFKILKQILTNSMTKLSKMESASKEESIKHELEDQFILRLPIVSVALIFETICLINLIKFRNKPKLFINY